MYIQFVGTAIVISLFNKVVDAWIKKGSTVKVRLPSTSGMVPVATHQAITRGTIRRIPEWGLQQVHQHFSVPGALFSQINLWCKNLFQLHLLGKHRNLALSCGFFSFQICTKINIPGQHMHMNFILKSHVLGRAH